MRPRHRNPRDHFSVAQFFLKLVTLAKKDMNALEWLGELRKDIKESAAEQLCVDDISAGLSEFNDSWISGSSESPSTSLSSFQIFTEPFFPLTSIFLPARDELLHSLMFYIIFLLRFFKLVCFLTWSMFTYNLRWLKTVFCFFGAF